VVERWVVVVERCVVGVDRRVVVLGWRAAGPCRFAIVDIGGPAVIVMVLYRCSQYYAQL
jgi:hypothetical protein